MKYTASINIEIGVDKDYKYIVTPNVSRVVGDIINSVNDGIHSFSIIGSYGTGKSSFIIALEQSLLNKRNDLISSSSIFFGCKKFEILNLVGEYCSLQRLISEKLNCESLNTLDYLKKYIRKVESQQKGLLIVVDEFGKILEHAAKNNPEEELYFLQRLAEIINDHNRKVVLLTALHQNFGSYSHGLNEAQRNEWQKVKGRFKEVVFSEPVEQLLFLAAEQIGHNGENLVNKAAFSEIFKIAKVNKLISDSFSEKTAERLFPLDPLAATCLTLAIQKYGQNERSLFSFLTTSGRYSISDFEAKSNYTYNLAEIYDYLIYNFYSSISEVNMDSAGWTAIKVAIGRIESGIIDEDIIVDCEKIAKTIGLLNIFANSDTSFNKECLHIYSQNALGISNFDRCINSLEKAKIIRFASYRSQYILFEGTDVNIESELLKASAIVPTPQASIDEIKDYIKPRISLAYASYFKTGTPRYFEFIVKNEPEVKIPEGEIDGYCELIFPLEKETQLTTIEQSANNPNANIYAIFKNVDDITYHLHEIKKLQYVLERIAPEDKVAKKEIINIQQFEKNKLNDAINNYLFCGNNKVEWIYKGKRIKIESKKDFNKLLSSVCDDVYRETPCVKNELFNKQKLSSAISLAKSNLLDLILVNSDKEDLGFSQDEFPPEKAIYYSLLKRTGIHQSDDEGTYFFGEPTGNDISGLWNACEEFIKSSSDKPKKISDLIKMLSAKPLKLKQGFIDFWVPIFLFIRQQDFAIYTANGAYVMDVNKELFELIQKHPSEYSIKAFNVEGIRLEFFKKYQQFLNKEVSDKISKDSFTKIFKPFLRYYRGLNPYTKSTKKFNNPSVIRFRDVLANASDPEKAFFDDLPEALGYKGSLTNNSEFIEDYLNKIHSVINELNACYPELIRRIELAITSKLGLSQNFDEYKAEIHNRYQSVKRHLLTQKAKTFLDRLLAPSASSTEYIEKISSVVLDKQLQNILDKEEEFLVDNIIFLFNELDRYVNISIAEAEETEDTIYSLGFANNKGFSVPSHTYRLPKRKENAANKIEEKISKNLSGDNELDVCILLKMLSERMK